MLRLVILFDDIQTYVTTCTETLHWSAFWARWIQLATSYIISLRHTLIFFYCGAATQCGSWPPHSWGFLDHIQRRSTVGRTPLDEWSACRTDLCVTTHNFHNRQTSTLAVGFEPTISAGKRPQNYALDRAANGTGKIHFNITLKSTLISYKLSFHKQVK